jgi:hypothetical protein
MLVPGHGMGMGMGALGSAMDSALGMDTVVGIDMGMDMTGTGMLPMPMEFPIQRQPFATPSTCVGVEDYELQPPADNGDEAVDDGQSSPLYMPHTSAKSNTSNDSSTVSTDSNLENKTDNIDSSAGVESRFSHNKISTSTNSSHSIHRKDPCPVPSSSNMHPLVVSS